jgi:hypothetical protein
MTMPALSAIASPLSRAASSASANSRVALIASASVSASAPPIAPCSVAIPRAEFKGSAGVGWGGTATPIWLTDQSGSAPSSTTDESRTICCSMSRTPSGWLDGPVLNGRSSHQEPRSKRSKFKSFSTRANKSGIGLPLFPVTGLKINRRIKNLNRGY